MQQFREVSRTRTIYSTETHTSDFIFNTFWNGKPVQFFQERCCVVMTGCQENKSCSKVLNFLERLDDRIRCTHKETVAVVKPWKDVGSNKSLGCIFSEKPADWTNAFKLEISSLADFYDVLLHGQFWVKNESKVPGRIREGDVVRAKSNRVREGTGRRFQGRRKGKEKSFCFVVVQFELIFRHPCFYVVCACIEFFGEVGHFIERSGFLELCVICEKLMVYRVVSYDIGERRSVQDEENGPQYWALRYTVHEFPSHGWAVCLAYPGLGSEFPSLWVSCLSHLPGFEIRIIFLLLGWAVCLTYPGLRSESFSFSLGGLFVSPTRVWDQNHFPAPWVGCLSHLPGFEIRIIFLLFGWAVCLTYPGLRSESFSCSLGGLFVSPTRVWDQNHFPSRRSSATSNEHDLLGFEIRAVRRLG